MIKNKKAFTMVELLATIVILGLLVGVVVIASSNIKENSRQQYCISQESMITLAGKDYFADYRSKLPKKIGNVEKVSLTTLIEEQYIAEIKDSNGEKCDYEKSYVAVQKQGEEQYNYYTYLKCKSCESSTSQAGPTITFTPNSKSTNENLTVTMTIKDDRKVDAYSYIVYKDGTIYRTVDKTDYTNKVEITLKETGIYQIVGTGYDNEGNVGSSTSGNYEISKTNANCKITITANRKEKVWSKDPLEFKMNFESGVTDWEWYESKDGKEFVKKGNFKPNVTTMTIKEDGVYRIRVYAYDQYRNRCEVTTDEYYMGDEPIKVELTGSIESGKLTNEDVILIATITPKQTDNKKYTYIYERKKDNGWEQMQSGESNIYRVIGEEEEGKHTYRVRLEREGKEPVVSNSYDTYIDVTPPTIPTLSAYYGTNSSYSSGKWVHQAVTTTPKNSVDTLSGFSHYEYRSKEGTSPYTSYQVVNQSVSSSQNGSYTLQFRACDKIGNCSTPKSITVNIDTIAPTCTVSGGGDTVHSGQVTLVGTCKDEGGSQCVEDKITKTFDVSDGQTKDAMETPGTVEDNAGNKTKCEEQRVRIVKIKPTAPTVNLYKWKSNSQRPTNATNLEKYVSGKWSNKYIYIVLENTSSAVGGVYYEYMDSKSNVHQGYPETIETDGKHSYKFRTCAKESGLCSDWTKEYNLWVDTIAPTCTVSGGDNSIYYKEVTLVGTCKDEGGSQCVEDRIAKTFDVPIGEKLFGDESPGTVKDNAGNQTECAAKRIHISKEIPNRPIVNLYKWRYNDNRPTSATNLGRYTPGEWSNKYIYIVLENTSTAIGEVYYEYKDGESDIHQGYPETVEADGLSVYSFRTCVKGSGLCSDWTKEYEMWVDTTPPTNPTVAAYTITSSTAYKLANNSYVSNKIYIYTYAFGSRDEGSGVKGYNYKAVNSSGQVVSDFCTPTIDDGQSVTCNKTVLITPYDDTFTNEELVNGHIYYYKMMERIENSQSIAQYQACDNVGNCSDLVNFNVTYFDTTEIDFSIDLYQWKDNQTRPSNSTGLTVYRNGWSNKNIYAVAKLKNSSDKNFDHFEYRIGSGSSTSAPSLNITDEGTTTLAFRVCPKIGTCQRWHTTTISIDKTAPIFKQFKGYDGNWTTKPVTISADFTDTVSGVDSSTYEFQSCSFSKNCDVETNWNSTQLSSSITINGAYYVRARVKDKAGNLSAWSTKFATRVDNLAPNTPYIDSISVNNGKICYQYSYCSFNTALGTKYPPGQLMHSDLNTAITCKFLVLMNPGTITEIPYSLLFSDAGSGVQSYWEEYSAYQSPRIPTDDNSTGWLGVNTPFPNHPITYSTAEQDFIYKSMDRVGNISPELRINVYFQNGITSCSDSRLRQLYPGDYSGYNSWNG